MASEETRAQTVRARVGAIAADPPTPDREVRALPKAARNQAAYPNAILPPVSGLRSIPGSTLMPAPAAGLPGAERKQDKAAHRAVPDRLFAEALRAVASLPDVALPQPVAAPAADASSARAGEKAAALRK